MSTESTSTTSTPGQDVPLLEVRDLEVSFSTSNGDIQAVKGVDLTVYPGQTVAIVGESGSGKSTSAHAVIGLLPENGNVTGGTIKFAGRDITHLKAKESEALRGSEIGLVPQDPMSNLNPVWRIGYQVKESLKANGVKTSRAGRQQLAGALVSEELSTNQDDDLYLGSDAKKTLIAELTTALGQSSGAEGKIADADERLAVGSSTRAETRKVMAELGLPDAEARVNKLVTGGSIDDRVAGLLAEAGLKDAERRARQYPHEFSGGMRQRALIAIGLAARPQLLIADEPTSALDVTVQRTILDHLGGLTKELGTAVLFITHDLGLAAERAEHLVVMYRGNVVESGPARQILESPKHPYTRRLVASAPSLSSRRIQSEHVAAAQVSEGDAPRTDEVDNVIVAKDLTKVFRLPGKRPGSHTDFTAVDSISFELPRGKTLALVGESGSGKSTAANMALNLLDPTSGSITFDGVDVTTLKKAELFKFRRRVQPIFQNPYGSLDPMFSIYRSIEEPLRVHKVGNAKEREARVRELLDLVSLPQSMMHRFPNELSGGQRQRVAIARALALKPDVIVCDEAVSALDVLVQAQILTLLNDLQAEFGLSYLFITHDLAVVRQIADHVCVMQQGKIVEQAATDDVFDNPQEDYTRELLAAIPGASLNIGTGSID